MQMDRPKLIKRDFKTKPPQREGDRTARPERAEDGAGSSYVVGRRAALELLHSEHVKQRVEKVYIAHGVHGPQISEILSLVRANRLAHTELDRNKFRDLEQRVSDNTDSQGVIVLTAMRAYQTIEEVLGLILPGIAPLFIALDGVEDPHNVGAILRSAEAAGAHAVLLHARKAALTPAIFKTSAGAAEHMPIIKYGNLDQTLRELRDEHGFRIYGLAGEGAKTIFEADLTEPVLLITGGEEKGIHHLIRERCDELIRIPLSGNTASLNASVATAVVLFEAVRQRFAKKS